MKNLFLILAMSLIVLASCDKNEYYEIIEECTCTSIENEPFDENTLKIIDVYLRWFASDFKTPLSSEWELTKYVPRYEWELTYGYQRKYYKYFLTNRTQTHVYVELQYEEKIPNEEITSFKIDGLYFYPWEVKKMDEIIEGLGVEYSKNWGGIDINRTFRVVENEKYKYSFTINGKLILD